VAPRIRTIVWCAVSTIACAGIASAQAPAVTEAPLDSAAAIALLHSTCPSASAPAGTGLLEGVVRDAETHPAGSVAVTIVWHGANDTHITDKRAAAAALPPALGTLSDSLGHWHICGAPLRTPLVVRAAGDDGFDEFAASLDDAHAVASVDFTLRTIASGGGSARAPQTSAIVVFSVEDRNGNTLAGVTLEVTPAIGAPHKVVTDADGRAIVPALQPGRAKVNSLAIGYRPGEIFVPLDAGRNTVPMILDAVKIPTLATVRVIGDRTMLSRHQEFEARRAQHLTTVSITADDIDKRNPIETWQMLTNVASMRVTQGAGMAGVYAMSNREQPVVRNLNGAGGGASVPCWYRVMIDNVLLPDAQPDLSLVLPNPHEVHGIEVFAGLATIPVQYNQRVTDAQGNTRSNTCGLIVVWTK
jgi:hypothetical protein